MNGPIFRVAGTRAAWCGYPGMGRVLRCSDSCGPPLLMEEESDGSDREIYRRV